MTTTSSGPDPSVGSPGGEERSRLAEADAGTRPWRAWGPYVSERAWGTVREDYSPDGSAWDHFPHEHARSRAYRWNEDGMAAVCDEQQTFCLGLALWNGADPFLKERMFGLTGPQGNHGEDAKEYWWYTDSTPTHSWMAWRYHYPQVRYPYEDLIEENGRRDGHDGEYELVDTDAFAGDRYWAVTVSYAKAAPEDLCMVIEVTNHGPDTATLHVLPTLWFRNTWSWGLPAHEDPDAGVAPVIRRDGGALLAEHRRLGRLRLVSSGPDGPDRRVGPDGPAGRRMLFCDNETNADRLWGVPGRSAFPKDGINDHVVTGAPTVNPDERGTKAAVHHMVTVESGRSATIRVRLATQPSGASATSGTSATSGWSGPLDLAGGFDAVVAARRAEADAYFDALAPSGVSADEALVLRQATAPTRTRPPSSSSTSRTSPRR